MIYRTYAVILAAAMMCATCGSNDSDSSAHLTDGLGAGSSETWDEAALVGKKNSGCSDMIVRHIDYCGVVNVNKLSGTQATGGAIASDGKNDVDSPTPVSARPELMVDVGQLGWRVIEESDCDRQQEDGYRWDVELSPGPLSSASVVVVTRAQEDSLVAELYRGKEGEPLGEGWLTSAQPPHLGVEVLADRSLLVVEGVPGTAVDQRVRQVGPELVELDVPCWGQRWDRRITGEELSDVDVLHGDAALVRLVRDRAAGARPVANARHSNIFRYISGDEDVVLMDLRPQAVIMLTAYSEHPLPEIEELVELVGG